jgi:hypothetical protein
MTVTEDIKTTTCTIFTHKRTVKSWVRGVRSWIYLNNSTETSNYNTEYNTISVLKLNVEVRFPFWKTVPRSTASTSHSLPCTFSVTDDCCLQMFSNLRAAFHINTILVCYTVWCSCSNATNLWNFSSGSTTRIQKEFCLVYDARPSEQLPKAGLLTFA